MRARLFGFFLVVCLINPFMHAHYALSNSPNPEEPPNPVRIEIEPKNVSIFCQSFAKFKATAYNKDGGIEDRVRFTWKVDNPDIGSVIDGLLYTKSIEAEGKIAACYKDLCASADVKVTFEPPKISLMEEIADFGDVEWGKQKTIHLRLRNASSTGTYLNLIMPGSNMWFSASLNSNDPVDRRKTTHISLNLNFKNLEKKCEKESSFIIRWFYVDGTGKMMGEGNLTVPVKVKVHPTKCAKFVPSSLYFGKVSRGQIKTMSFAVVFTSQRNVKGSFVLDVPWLTIIPKEFTTVYENLPADQVKLILDTKKLPKGGYHAGYVTVKSDACEDLKLSVHVNTEEKVTAKISVGKNEGTINGNKVTFANPPTIKNNRTFLTPEIFEKIFFTKTRIEGDKLEIIWQSKKILGKVATINGVQYADLSIRYFTETIGASVSYSAKDKSTTFVWTPE